MAVPLFPFTVFATGGVAEKTAIALATNALAIAASPTIRFEVSNETALHMEDTAPTALSTAGTPNAVAFPIRSMYQTDCSAVRLIFGIDWKWRCANAIAWMTTLAW